MPAAVVRNGNEELGGRAPVKRKSARDGRKRAENTSGNGGGSGGYVVQDRAEVESRENCIAFI